jgi:hypothetical protein
MDLVGAGQPVPQPPNLPIIQWIGDIAGEDKARLRARARHIGKRRDQPEGVLLRSISREGDEQELVAEPEPRARLGSVPVDDVADIDAIGDRDDAFGRVVRVRPQILPPNELADAIWRFKVFLWAKLARSKKV